MTKSIAEFSEKKFGLGIHTASPELGLAISNFSRQKRSQVWELGRTTSTHFHMYLEEFLSPQQWSDLAFIAVAKGPGGFTGTRIGVVAARTLAQQLNIPLFGISTLACVAWASLHNSALQSFKDSIPPEIAVEMNARQDAVFGAVYRLKAVDHSSPNSFSSLNLKIDKSKLAFNLLVPSIEDTVFTQSQWQTLLNSRQTNCQVVRATGNLGQTAPYLIELAAQKWQQGDRPHWSEVLPYYGQSPV